VVYGTMPSRATLFDHQAKPIHSFPSAARNFVAFNPHGRVICIAGFGNLAGEIVSGQGADFEIGFVG
jgi:translation initiation factor 2A